MKTVFKYSAVVSGIERDIEFDRTNKTYAVRADGDEVAKYQRNWRHYASFFCVPFDIDGVECSFISTNLLSTPFLVIDRQYVNARRIYGSPPNPVPTIFWVLFAVSIALTLFDLVLLLFGKGVWVTLIAPILFAYLSTMFVSSPLAIDQTNQKQYQKTLVSSHFFGVLIWAFGICVALFPLLHDFYFGML